MGGKYWDFEILVGTAMSVDIVRHCTLGIKMLLRRR
jgi:hypothetical protein